MQAYATSERLPLGDQLRTLDRTSVRTAATAGDSDRAVVDQIWSRLADLVVDSLMEPTTSPRWSAICDNRARARPRSPRYSAPLAASISSLPAVSASRPSIRSR